MKQEIQIGGFKFQKTTRGVWGWLRIEAQSGYWSMILRSDNVMYQVLDNMLKSGYQEWVHSYIQQAFIAASVSPDAEWAEDFARIYESYVNRIAQSQAEPTEDEQKEALEEVMVNYVAQQENEKKNE